MKTYKLRGRWFDDIRVLTDVDQKTLLQRTLKLSEETGELAAAVIQNDGAHGTEYKDKPTIMDIGEEAVDCIIVAASVLAHIGLNDEDIQKIYSRKMNKWKWALEQKALNKAFDKMGLAHD